MNSINISIINTIEKIGENDWNNCSCPEKNDNHYAIDPFTTYNFLYALEKSGSVGEKSGWLPYHILVIESNKIIGVMPLYIKLHSQGEYIFDHNWADAYQRLGKNYYPKLQSAVPFSPVTGRRFLSSKGNEDKVKDVLITFLQQHIKENNISSFHITFCNEDEYSFGKTKNLLGRETIQYHWKNDNYSSFDDFLSTLSSRKRKNIKKEREKARKFGGVIKHLKGNKLEKKHWDYFWNFYQDTGRRKWGTPYLNRNFFDIIHEKMSDDVLLILAEKDDIPIAGALHFIGAKTLFGRYWGTSEYNSFLHYELCYYQAIDFAVENNFLSVEAGAQGDHKISRGYNPEKTFSLHLFENKGFNNLINDYLNREKEFISNEITEIEKFLPYKTEEFKNE